MRIRRLWHYSEDQVVSYEWDYSDGQMVLSGRDKMSAKLLVFYRVEESITR